MKNSRKTILPALIVALAVAMLALCACQSTTATEDNSLSASTPESTSESAEPEFNPELPDGGISATVYKQAWDNVQKLYPYAERNEKIAYAEEAQAHPEEFLSGIWQPSDEVVDALEQSQDEILALIESGEDSPRLDPYNLGIVDSRRNDDDGPGPGPSPDHS